MSTSGRERLLRREVRREGATVDEFEGREAELRAYLERSSGRFDATLALLDSLALSADARVLELGADPWLFTQLLVERGLTPVSAGQRRGVWREDERLPACHRVELAWGDRRAVLDHHLFNAERDRWPFEDAEFDCVVCMDVIEHLVYSPSHLFYEASRVLVQSGALLVTTPNALAATKLARLLRGRNVHGQYSGNGAHGRHNREFAPDELVELLELAGFDSRVELENLAGYRADDLLGRALQAVAGAGWRSRRDHLLAVGRKRRAPRLAFPARLYRSVDRNRMRADGVVLPDERGAGPP